jgi:ribosomal protein S24E
VVAACICLLGVGAAGCSTTQDKAAAKKIESEHILKAQAAEEKASKQAEKKHQHAKSKAKKKGQK